MIVAVLVLCSACSKPPDSNADQLAAQELASWQSRAQNVTIVRDDWGIPHIHGKTDADAIFGLMYAQAEDDFNRVETNYLLSQGRLAEAEGEQEIWRDLRMRLFIDPEELQHAYATSDEWLKELMNAWADGLNFYLRTHPEVKPRVLTRFEPWMALSFSEGSIGGDIERVSLSELQAFYEGAAAKTSANREMSPTREPGGSNGFAIAPSNSATNHALLWINPHTSFFFRTEAQVTSDAGLNAYGALTWGQFFVYQGFNERAGWMHTSSGVDNIDEYLETVKPREGGGYVYEYAGEDRKVRQREVVIRYRTPAGMAERKFDVYRTQHGPIVRAIDGRWVSVRLMEEPVKALTQSYLRTRAKNLKEFMQIMNLHANSSNNTVFADAEGNIAYLHSNFVPLRDEKFDWSQPVDGSDPQTDWHGVQSVAQAPNVINPSTGWLYNTNNAPWSAAGPDSPKEKDYPAYVDRSGENARGLLAAKVLSAKQRFTMDDVVAAAFDSRLLAFDRLLPPLFDAYRQLPKSDPLQPKLLEQIALLRKWDRRWSTESVATTLAVTWADELLARTREQAARERVNAQTYMAERASARERLDALAAVTDRLASDFGDWRVPFGEINRFQRLTGDIVQPFDDAAPSLPVGFTSGNWGSLAAFGGRVPRDTKKIYGVSGNSFLAIVEFGDRVRAKAITAGGQSGDPRSPHFNDQAERYTKGQLRDVYFYPDQLAGHIEREYRPGQVASRETASP
jgi:acyl-homoserine-lactone acylase